jgi:large subunit ribosomal protein L20
MRVKRGTTRRRKHNKVLKSTKGYRMSKHTLYRVAHESYMHAGNYAYRHRQRRAGDFRKIWIAKINAACKNNGIKYNDFINKLKTKNIQLDRKVLADIAQNNPAVFTSVIKSL